MADPILNEHPIRVGSIVEIDRTHLSYALKLPVERRRFAGKVTLVFRDPDCPGWLFIRVNSAKSKIDIQVAVPPVGSRCALLAPKLRVIR